MPTDAYTKAVLTVIAACLVILVARGTPLVGTAHADSDKVLAVDLVRVNGRSLMGSYAVPVDLQRVSGSTVSGAVPVRNR